MTTTRELGYPSREPGDLPIEVIRHHNYAETEFILSTGQSVILTDSERMRSTCPLELQIAIKASADRAKAKEEGINE